MKQSGGMIFDDVFKIRCFLICWCLVLALTGCQTPQPAYATIPTRDFACSFSKAPVINPRIIQALSTWISDTGDQVVAINVLEAQNCNRYAGEFKAAEIKGHNPWVYIQSTSIESGETNLTTFGYRCIGQTDSGIYVLETSDSEGGSGSFRSLLLVKFEYDHSISCDWDKSVVQAGKNRLLIKKVGEIALGDRWDGAMSVKGNSILVGKDKGIFAGTEKGGRLSEIPKDRWLKIDLGTTPQRSTSARPN